MNRTRAFTAGIVICGLLGVFDVLSLVAAGSDDGPPWAVAVGGAVLGIVTLVGIWYARRGSRSALMAVVISRVLSALLGVPVFFVDDVPDGAPAIVAICIVLTAIGVPLLLKGATQVSEAV